MRWGRIKEVLSLSSPRPPPRPVVMRPEEKQFDKTDTIVSCPKRNHSISNAAGRKSNIMKKKRKEKTNTQEVGLLWTEEIKILSPLQLAENE